MSKENIYEESISSKKTENLFLGLIFIFFFLFMWRVGVEGFQALPIVFLSLSVFFLLYVLNYRTLNIQISSDALTLRFGIFTWTESFDNIADCTPDDALPPILKYGGAGIHFYTFEKRYRASFNFLEYSRVVVKFREQKGLVKELSFSTRQPDEIIQLIQMVMVVEE